MVFCASLWFSALRYGFLRLATDSTAQSGLNLQFSYQRGLFKKVAVRWTTLKFFNRCKNSIFTQNSLEQKWVIRGELQQSYRKRVEEDRERGSQSRESQWTESMAVGSKVLIEATI